MTIKIHSKFKLNGRAYTKAELKILAYNLIKEGESFEQEIGAFLSNWLDHTAELLVETSGSTGKPKTITLQKKHMINSALATAEYFKLDETKTALLCLPVRYIAGKMMLVRAMVLGLRIDYTAPASNPLDAISKAYDFCAMVPMQLENSLEKLNQIATLIVGGAPISARLKQKLLPKSTEVYETYGMTETITHIAVKKINGNESDTFKTLPHVKVAQDDRDCLIIEAPKVTTESLVTNDLVQLISETEFRWLGRYDFVINSGGVKLNPEQIEQKLALLITPRFFVAGMPDEQLGEKLVLLVEGAVDTKKLVRELKETTYLDRFELPKQVYALEKFAETETGKIQRSQTLALLELH